MQMKRVGVWWMWRGAREIVRPRRHYLGEDINGRVLCRRAHLSRPFLCATVLLRMAKEGAWQQTTRRKNRDKLNKIRGIEERKG